jgi:hypothetical protein
MHFCDLFHGFKTPLVQELAPAISGSGWIIAGEFSANISGIRAMGSFPKQRIQRGNQATNEFAANICG